MSHISLTRFMMRDTRNCWSLKIGPIFVFSNVLKKCLINVLKLT